MTLLFLVYTCVDIYMHNFIQTDILIENIFLVQNQVKVCWRNTGKENYHPTNEALRCESQQLFTAETLAVTSVK